MMDFKQLLERYKSGEASEEERRLVEAELEKHRLIGEYLDEQWEKELSIETLAPADAREVKQLKRHVRLRTWGTVIVSLVLVAALLAGAFAYLQNQYYNPNQNGAVMPGERYRNGFYMEVRALTELSLPGYAALQATATPDGFASYTVNVSLADTMTSRQDSASGRIIRGSFTGNVPYFYQASYNYFGTHPFQDVTDENTIQQQRLTNAVNLQRTLDELDKLPDSAMATAFITFDEDFSLEELRAWTMDAKVGLYYVAVRNGYEHDMLMTGFDPNTQTMLQLDEAYLPDSETYPYFSLQSTPDYALYSSAPVPYWGAHYKSLLRYMANHGGLLDALGVHSAETYADILSYTEENGINVYGVLARGSANNIAALLEQPEVYEAWIYNVQLSSYSH